MWVRGEVVSGRLVSGGTAGVLNGGAIGNVFWREFVQKVGDFGLSVIDGCESVKNT